MRIPDELIYRAIKSNPKYAVNLGPFVFPVCLKMVGPITYGDDFRIFDNRNIDKDPGNPNNILPYQYLDKLIKEYEEKTKETSSYRYIREFPVLILERDLYKELYKKNTKNIKGLSKEKMEQESRKLLFYLDTYLPYKNTALEFDSDNFHEQYLDKTRDEYLMAVYGIKTIRTHDYCNIGDDQGRLRHANTSLRNGLNKLGNNLGAFDYTREIVLQYREEHKKVLGIIENYFLDIPGFLDSKFKNVGLPKNLVYDIAILPELKAVIYELYDKNL